MSRTAASIRRAGSGCIRIESTILKIAVFAPMARPSQDCDRGESRYAVQLSNRQSEILQEHVHPTCAVSRASSGCSFRASKARHAMAFMPCGRRALDAAAPDEHHLSRRRDAVSAW
jgi:hypothetical protein